MPLCPKCHFQWESTLRSIQQNKGYWKVCVEPLTAHLEDQGYDSNDVHELLKSECNYEIKFLRDKSGSISEKRIPLSTTNLTMKQFNEFMAKVRKYASSLGCVLLEPNESLEVIK